MKPLILVPVAVAAATLALARPMHAAPPDSRFSVTYARIVDGRASRYLVIRVKGPARTVRVRVTQMDRRRRVLRVAVRGVRTNRRTRVPRLAIVRKASTVKIRIVGHVG